MALTKKQIEKVEAIFNEYDAMNNRALAKMSECTDAQTMRIAENDADRSNCAINALQRCMTACGCLAFVEWKDGKQSWRIRNDK
jgi:hypothetical protein